MRVVILYCVAAVLVSASSVSTAADPKKAVDPGQKVVCKTEDVVGSRIPKRICLTRQQWEQIKDNARDALEKRQMWAPEKTISG